MFDVWFTPTGMADYRALRADVAGEVDAAVERLARDGCLAANYRLAGKDSDVGHLCVVRLSRQWRVVIAFPAEDEVTLLLIGQHLRGARSVYERLYRLLGVDEPGGDRNRPPCCDDGVPPADADLVSHVVTSAQRLRRG